MAALADADFAQAALADRLREVASGSEPALEAIHAATKAKLFGICLRVLKIARDGGEWMPRPKSLNYLNALVGARELGTRSQTASDEGLFLSRGDEYVVETARQNVAWIRDGRICYPDPAIGALAGTGLAWLLELDCAAQPCRASLDEFLRAEAIIVINSVRGVTAVREVRDKNDHVLLTALASQVHPIVASLRHQWDEALQTTARLLPTGPR